MFRFLSRLPRLFTRRRPVMASEETLAAIEQVRANIADLDELLGMPDPHPMRLHWTKLAKQRAESRLHDLLRRKAAEEREAAARNRARAIPLDEQHDGSRFDPTATRPRPKEEVLPLGVQAPYFIPRNPWDR
ncbi:hypothetical protein [Bosea sp. ANAM02]|uniref:hypothetical protein n=1 Tax=Bosea sp. ANAM02 TaxID=2020412 RepID=UPI00140EBEEA|nr:hypothetical protein [Bosea sp. ANAM02]BCB20282.1 hypothetical protein OCUBac02_31760 [Bosea sp. ANAM02]